MVRILNRLAWFVALILGWFAMFYIATSFDYNDVGKWFVPIVLIGILIGMALKGMFLSEDFIRKNVE